MYRSDTMVEGRSGEMSLINNDFCEACQSGGRLLLCEHCPRAFHVQCIERLVDLERLKTSEKWLCPVCEYGEGVLRGKHVEEMPEGEMKARMMEALQVSKRMGQMAVRQRDSFLLSHLLEVLPFASRRAQTRILKMKEGRRPLEVGTIVQVDTGMAFYDAIILAQANTNLYLVADLESRTQELKEEKWLLSYHPGHRAGEVPDFLNFARKAVVSETTHLKEYQKTGVNWLIQSFYNRCGGILADDMGLGKTLQTLAFLSYLRVSGAARGPALVVVPLSCAGNWAREAKRFVPHLSIAKVCGTVKERQRSLDDNEIWYGMKDVIITTYETLMSTEDFFQRHYWSVLVLDEAHRIKNQSSKVREVMDTVPCAARFLLTGTPLQNNLGELFALLKFLWPDVMAKESEMFENAIQLPELQDKAMDETAKAKVDHILVQKIRHILGMVMLRRRKEEVIRLPRKIFHDVWLPSTPLQVSWYKRILQLQKVSMSRDMRALKKLLVRLRSVTCHPRTAVANKEDRDYLVSFGITTQEELDRLCQPEISEEVIAESSKLTFLDKLLMQLHCQNMGISDSWRKAFEDRQAKISPEKKRKSAAAWLQGTSGTLFLDEMQPRQDDGEGETAPMPHKVLIFCQYIATLDFLESYCAYRNWRSLRMDGATSRVLRELDMRDFNSHDEDLFVYLIGTRAGGLGVNLASANHVVIFEQDWNPHVDHQAIDRAHRIGQQRKVHVHRPVQEWGIEERLVRRATNKLQMEKCIINAKEEDEEELLAESEDTLTSEEILNLLKHGASAFKAFKGENTEAYTLQELLDRERQPVPTQGPEAVSSSSEERQEVPLVPRAERPRARPADVPPPPDVEAARSSSGRVIKARKTFAEEFQEAPLVLNRKPKVTLKHFSKCFVCNEGCEVPKRRSKQKLVEEPLPGLPVEICCSSCPQSYHQKCLPPHAHELKKNWICSWHYCSQCNRGVADVGGMLIHCLECPSALCYDCFPPNFRRVYPDERFWLEMKKRGWNTSPQKMIFFKCNSCRTLEEQQTRLRMRAEDLAVQQDEKKRAALEEKRSLEMTKKRQEQEEATRRMKSFLLDYERQQLAQEQMKWSSRVERAAESMWPKTFWSKWISRVNLSKESAEEIGRAMVGKKATLPSLERLKLTLETCSNCHFPGHKAKQCPLPMEKVTAKNEEEGKTSYRRYCPICEHSGHARICCPQLSQEQRKEYNDRCKDFKKLLEVFQEAASAPEPKKVKEIKETAALVATYRTVEVAMREHVREVMKRAGFDRLVVFSAAEEAAEAKVAADRAKAAEKAEKAAEAARTAAKKAAERKAAKEEALAKAAAAKAKAKAKAAEAKAKAKAKAEAAEAKAKAKAGPKSRSRRAAPAEAEVEQVPQAKRRKTDTGKSAVEIQFIQDGPAVGWAVKGVSYNSGTQYFVKRPDSTLWETRYQALKDLDQDDAIVVAVQAARVQVADKLVMLQNKVSSSDTEKDRTVTPERPARPPSAALDAPATGPSPSAASAAPAASGIKRRRPTRAEAAEELGLEAPIPVKKLKLVVSSSSSSGTPKRAGSRKAAAPKAAATAANEAKAEEPVPLTLD